MSDSLNSGDGEDAIPDVTHGQTSSEEESQSTTESATSLVPVNESLPDEAESAGNVSTGETPNAEPEGGSEEGDSTDGSGEEDVKDEQLPQTAGGAMSDAQFLQLASAIGTLVTKSISEQLTDERISRLLLPVFEPGGRVGDAIASLEEELKTMGSSVTSLGTKVNSLNTLESDLDSWLQEATLLKTQLEMETDCLQDLVSRKILETVNGAVATSLAAFTGVVSKLESSLSASYLGWVASALQAAKQKLDASVYASELETAVESLRDSLAQVGGYQSVVQRLESFMKSVDSLTLAYGVLAPHMEAFSRVAAQRADTTYATAAERLSRAACNVKSLLSDSKDKESFFG